MQLGLFAMPVHRPEKPWEQALAEDREAVILADRLGFAEAWIGEHFSTRVEGIPSPLMFLASVIPETRRIRLGSGVVNLPHHHPAVVAAEAAMFDCMSGGRLMLGVGPGGLASDAELFGHEDMAARTVMAEEAIDAILAFWGAEPPFRFEGRHWSFGLERNVWPRLGVGVMPKPMQQPHPPLAMAMVSPNPSAAAVVAARDMLAISANFVAEADVAAHWRAYRTAREALGRPADPAIWRVSRSILVTESRAEAEDVLADPDGLFAFYFRYLRSLRRIPELAPMHDAPVEALDAELDVARMIEQCVIAGPPIDVLDRLVGLRETVGPFGTLLMVGHDFDEAGVVKRGMRTLAEDVFPRFARHARALDDR